VSELPRLHVVTDDAILQSPDFLTRAGDLIRALGVHGVLHIRGHHTSARRIHEIATTLAPLVINDRLDVALAVRAWGVQTGPRSFRVDEVRRLSPNLRIGVSVHAVDEIASGADWIMAGHIFETPSHAAEPARGLEFLRQICQASSVPVIAIGGIQPRDVKAVRDVGAYGVAVVRGIWDARAGAAHAYLGELARRYI
jgi:thiazole tautomerase (transcriptional regulator TenI)